MLAKWEQANTFADINALKDSTSNVDGETATIEFKGSRDRFDDGSKEKLSKEISAMANTYGGLLCFHNTQANDVLPFSTDKLEGIEKSLESWLSSATEPPVQGIRLKKIDGVFLLYVPESMTKPHRSSQKNKQYYYRSNSLSEPMPEIMVSSLYRAGQSLSIELNLNLLRQSNGQPVLFLSVSNNSRIVGTMPRFTLNFWGSKNPNCLMPAVWDHFEAGGSYAKLPHLGTTVAHLGVFRTKSSFREEILYPEDTLRLVEHLRFVSSGANDFRNFWDNDFILISLKVNFAECPQVTRWNLFEMANGTPTKPECGGEFADVANVLSARTNQ